MLLFLEGSYLKPEAIAHRRQLFTEVGKKPVGLHSTPYDSRPNKKCFEIYICNSPAFTAVLDTYPVLSYAVFRSRMWFCVRTEKAPQSIQYLLRAGQ